MKTNYLKLFVLVLLASILVHSAYAQEFELHGNLRNPKVDTVKMDWYLSAKVEFGTDSTYLIELKSSIERDNGVIYQAYIGSFEQKFCKAQAIYDQEIKASLGNISVYVPVWLFRFGADAQHDFIKDESKLGAYTSFIWKNAMTDVYLSTSYSTKEVNRVEYEVMRRLYVGNKAVLGIKGNGMFVDNEHRYNIGFTLLITL